MSDIKPALTKEEWTRDPRVVRDGFEFHLPADKVPWLSLGLEGSEEGYALSPDTFHALAALCLKDQPYGFTREMVEKLRKLESESHHPAASPFFGDVSFLLDVADSIDALLPREVTP